MNQVTETLSNHITAPYVMPDVLTLIRWFDIELFIQRINHSVVSIVTTRLGGKRILKLMK